MAVIVCIGCLGVACSIMSWLAIVINVLLIGAIVTGVVVAIIAYRNAGRVEQPHRVIQEAKRYEIG